VQLQCRHVYWFIYVYHPNIYYRSIYLVFPVHITLSHIKNEGIIQIQLK